MKLAIALLVMFLAAPLALVNAQTIVDWTLGKDYSSYSTQPFKSGDTILFNYNSKLHDLLVVSKSDYENCVAGNALQKFKDGKTSITLKQGTMYFICGIPGHCTPGGMKLQVTVGDTDSSTPTTPTPDSNSTTPSAPPPKNTNGAASLSSQLIIGVTLVLGTLFTITG